MWVQVDIDDSEKHKEMSLNCFCDEEVCDGEFDVNRVSTALVHQLAEYPTCKRLLLC